MLEFFKLFKVVGSGTVEIFLLGFCGFFVLKKGILAECTLKTLSVLIINMTLPCMIFSSVVTKFNTENFPGWWVYPLSAIVMVLLACGIGYIVSRSDIGLKEKKEFISLVGFNNSNFLPLPLVAAIFPPHEAEKYYIYIFLFLLGYMPVMASLGTLLISGKTFNRDSLKNVLNPPFYTIIISIVMAELKLGKYVPDMVMNPVKLLGDSTIPLSMIVLGGIIYVNIRDKVSINKKAIIKLSLVKLVLFPAIVFPVIYSLRLSRELGFLLFLQATMPPASSLISISQAFDGNSEFLGQSMFYTYVFSLFTIPAFIALYLYFY